MKNKWQHKAVCLVLAGSLLLTVPSFVYAAEAKIPEEETISQTETETETEKETETETETEKETETETETEKETETEPGTEKPVQATPLERVPEPDKQTEPALPDAAPPETGDNCQTEPATEPDVIVMLPEEPEGEPDDQAPDGAGDELQDMEDSNILHDPDGEQEDHSDAASDYTTNIIAGNGVYLSSLSGEYGLVFEEDFEAVMDQIEADYRAFLEKPDSFLAENWQDVLAVYVMRYRREHGNGQITMGQSCMEELERIFFLMNLRSNSAMRWKLETCRKLQAGQDAPEAEGAGVPEEESAEVLALNAADYSLLYDTDEEEKEMLERYTSVKCRQLCAIVTAARGFIRGEAGKDVSEERISIVAAACSLVGKVGYFWGGKSYAMGWDDRWGSKMTVAAEGSKSTGTVRAYGLDCSGFVAWSYYNGLKGSDAGIGNHTSSQWIASEMVENGQAKPGDLVFYRPASAGDDNHVGVVIGINEDGSLLVAHCSSGQNGVVTGEAWSSGFQYVRRPVNLP